MDTAAPPSIRTATRTGADSGADTPAHTPAHTPADSTADVRADLRAATRTGADDRVITTLAELCDLVRAGGTVYLRYSSGFATDCGGTSRDGESGLDLPGLSVNPLTPEAWWTRPLDDWLARQVCQYRHLAKEQERFPWVLTGECVGRGPDSEPLLARVVPLGRLHDDVLQEAGRVYDERFDAGNRP
ncbi:DUF6098 family protein [Arthrobacter sp. MDT1-65]